MRYAHSRADFAARLHHPDANRYDFRAMKKIGEYELLREIGRDEMASVWQAKRVTLGGATKLAAVKLMSREFEDYPHGREIFIAHTRLSMLLNYRNVVQVFDAGVDGGQCYVAMEWVDGLSLAQLETAVRSRGGSISPEVGAYVIGEVLRGLAYAQSIKHEGAPLGIAHGDLSPQDVLVSISGEVKLSEFGVGQIGGADRWRKQAPERLRYKAPEQLRRGAREPIVDLYAVGGILHELLDGRPFRGEIDAADLEGCVIEGVVPELQDGIEVPAELDTLRRGLLQADPTRRIQSAREALELLQRWSGYRDQSLQLERLCGAYMGVSAPRSGVHPQAAVVATPNGGDAS